MPNQKSQVSEQDEINELRAQVEERDKRIAELERVLFVVNNALNEAREALESAASGLGKTPSLNGYIERLGLSEQTFNGLDRAGIRTVEQLLDCYHEGLVLQCRRFHAGSVAEVEAALEPFGARKTEQKPSRTVPFYWPDMALPFRPEDHISALGLSAKSSNCLSRAGADTIGKATALYKKDGLVSVAGLGRKSISEIESKLIEIGAIEPPDSE